MDVIIEDNILYRFKKKWVNRYCQLVQTNTFSDSVKLLIFTHDESKSKRLANGGRKSYQIMSKHVVYGHLHGIHLNNESNVMFIVCKNSVECLAFKGFNQMKSWSDHLTSHLNDISQPVTLKQSDKYSQLKGKMDGRLLMNCSHISFIRDPSCSEPKLLMSWKIADIVEYGCSKEFKKSSSKNKTKGSVDLSQNIFFIKASPLYYRAPNIHIFSCPTPKQFCDRLETLSSNQENFHSPNEYDLVMQRSRTESFNTIRSSTVRNNESPNYFDGDGSPESPVPSSNIFFPDSTQSRVPRFQRSISEAPRRRSRMDSGNSIIEDKEWEMTDQSVSIMCQSANVATGSDLDSPVRSATFTFLERYPYEREPTRMPHRRHISEMMNHGSYRTLSSNLWTPEQRPFGPKSSSNYCSLVNLRPKLKLSPESSSSPNPDQTLSTSSKDQFPLHIDKDQGLVSRRSANLSDTSQSHAAVERLLPGYVNLEFTHIFEQISQLCNPGNDVEQTLQTSDTRI